MTATRSPHRWVVDFALLAALWGISFLFMRLATLEFGPVPTAALRVAVATAILLPLVAWNGHLPVLRRHWRPVLAVGLVNSALPFACFAFALLHITTGLSSILNATVPLFGAVVAWAWLGERPGVSRTLGLALGFGGVAALTLTRQTGALAGSTGSPMQVLAIGACLFAAFSYAIAANFTRRHLAGLPTQVTAAGSLLGATLALAVPALLTLPTAMPGPLAWMAILASGALSTALAYLLYFRLIETAGPSRTLAVTFAIPVFALAFGALFLGEAITGIMIACGAVVLLGTALSTGLLRLPRS